MVIPEVFGTFELSFLEVDTQRELVRNVLGKCFATDPNIMCQTDFSISLYFLPVLLTMPFLLHFAILKFGSSKLLYFTISVTGG